MAAVAAEQSLIAVKRQTVPAPLLPVALWKAAIRRLRAAGSIGRPSHDH
jgi:hypothetical protein